MALQTSHNFDEKWKRADPKVYTPSIFWVLTLKVKHFLPPLPYLILSVIVLPDPLSLTLSFPLSPFLQRLFSDEGLTEMWAELKNDRELQTVGKSVSVATTPVSGVPQPTADAATEGSTWACHNYCDKFSFCDWFCFINLINVLIWWMWYIAVLALPTKFNKKETANFANVYLLIVLMGVCYGQQKSVEELNFCILLVLPYICVWCLPSKFHNHGRFLSWKVLHCVDLCVSQGVGEGARDANTRAGGGGGGGGEEGKDVDEIVGRQKRSPFFNILAEWTWGQVNKSLQNFLKSIPISELIYTDRG